MCDEEVAAMVVGNESGNGAKYAYVNASGIVTEIKWFPYTETPPAEWKPCNADTVLNQPYEPHMKK